MWVPPSRPTPWDRPPPSSTTLLRRPLLLAALAAALVAAFALVVLWPSAEPGPPPVASQPSTESDNRTVPMAESIEGAKRWLQAYRTISYTDPAPTAWIDRALPLSTERLGRELTRLRGGSPGADWTTFVTRKCRTTIEDVEGTIPDEAPHTAAAAYVQLSGVAVTRCTSSRSRTMREDIALTVGVQRGPDGTWRVDRRLF